MKPQLSILLPLVAFPAVSAVLFTPGLPTISAEFGLSVGQTQSTMTTYLLGYALGQLPYGPLSNRFGRKKALYIGLSLAITGALLCAIAPSFELLLVARFIQALGACVGLKVCYTMIADSYDQANSAKMISRMLIAFALLPNIAIAVGGWLTHLFSWQSCFYFLAVYGAFILFLTTLLPETSKSLDPHALKIRSVLQGYLTKFKNKRLVISGLMMGCSSAVVYTFVSKSPFIGISTIGLPPEVFGTYNLIPLIGMLGGSLLSAKIAGRYPLKNILNYGIAAALVSALTMLILFAVGYINPMTLFVPMIFTHMASCCVYANVSSFGLSHTKNKSNGSAVLNFLNLSTTVAAVFMSEFIYPELPILLPLSFLFFYSGMLLLRTRLPKLDGAV